MLSTGEVEPRAPQSILGFGSALRTQGVLWRVEERRRCSSSRSFLTLLEKWTRCGVSIFFIPKSFRIHKPGSNTVQSLQMVVFFGLCSACDGQD